jgi:cell wall-associated NlpC family hydrolase
MLVGVLLVLSVSAVPVAEAAAKKKTFGSRTLSQGMSGQDVRVLQDFLNRYGLPIAIDGRFGAKTTRRVKAWEQRNDRRVDGKVTIADARLLRMHVQAGGASFTPEPPAPAPTGKARLLRDGTAVAPADAPPEVKAVIAAGNEIASKPYRYGGGHGRWKDSGYDCSGSVSYALHGGNFVDTQLDSSSLMSWGTAGKGRWITVYAHGGHTYMVVAGLRFDTSGARQSGSRWQTAKRSASGYTVRHPDGF